MEDRKQQEVAPEAMSERLDNLLAKAQDPAQIKTVKEFIADKRAAEAAEEMTTSVFSEVTMSEEPEGESESAEYISQDMSESEGPTTSRI